MTSEASGKYLISPALRPSTLMPTMMMDTLPAARGTRGERSVKDPSARVPTTKVRETVVTGLPEPSAAVKFQVHDTMSRIFVTRAPASMALKVTAAAVRPRRSVEARGPLAIVRMKKPAPGLGTNLRHVSVIL